MRDEQNEYEGCSFTFWMMMVVLACGFLGGLKLGLETIKCDAIKQGHAQYNPQTAKFEWKAGE